jgi:hypothetical protein
LEALAVSPILVRPVREQLEHDRLIRLLQAKLRRKFDAGINPGVEQNASVGNPPTLVYPDLVLFSLERSRRLQGVIEVETGESVNHLEALAQWTHLSKLRVPFHLYVPATMVDVARRLCEDNQIAVQEIWSYHSIGDQVRFALVHRSKEPPPVARAPVAKANGAKAIAVERPVKPAKPEKKVAAAPKTAKPKKNGGVPKNGKTAKKTPVKAKKLKRK